MGIEVIEFDPYMSVENRKLQLLELEEMRLHPHENSTNKNKALKFIRIRSY